MRRSTYVRTHVWQILVGLNGGYPWSGQFSAPSATEHGHRFSRTLMEKPNIVILPWYQVHGAA